MNRYGILYRMLPPIDASRQTLSRPGNGGAPRVLNAVPGEFLDVGESDAAALGANGWLFLTLVGPTANRPTGPGTMSAEDLMDFGALPGRKFLDTTIGRVIVFDGATWRDPATGGTV